MNRIGVITLKEIFSSKTESATIGGSGYGDIEGMKGAVHIMSFFDHEQSSDVSVVTDP